EIRHREMGEISFVPFVRHTVDCIGRGSAINDLAMLFHEQFSRAWAAVVIDASQRLKIDTIALSGGVFCNAILVKRLTSLLNRAGLRVLRNTIVPPNDGGIALGQAAIAAARLAARKG